MKKFRITYRSHQCLFGNNVFTEIMCGKSVEDAMYQYERDTHSFGLHEIISAEEV